MKRNGIFKHNHLILIGLLSLLLGAMIYLFYRPPTLLSTVVGSILPNTHSFLGQLGYNLPSFLHTFSFTLLTVGLGKLDTTGRWAAMLFWFITNIFFEIIQFNPIAEKIINETQFNSFTNFVQSGTFDFFDIIAITLGSILSFLFLTWGCRVTISGPFHKCKNMEVTL